MISIAKNWLFRNKWFIFAQNYKQTQHADIISKRQDNVRQGG